MQSVFPILIGMLLTNIRCAVKCGSSASSTTQTLKNLSNAEIKRRFLEEFDSIVEDTLKEDAMREIPEEMVKYVRENCNYNVLGGKYNRGLTVVTTLLAVKSQISEQDLKGAIALGWGIEFLQGCFLVADDVMDRSQTRRGQPCWYLKPEVQLNALNDYLILESFIFRIVRRFYRNTPYYMRLVEIFQDTAYQTELGQLMDLRSLPPQNETVDLNRFSVDLQKLIVKYKTAYYSFYLPWALGLIVSGVEDEKVYKQTEKIAIAMGEYFQIQDDFLDCYGTEEQIGKVGRDIEEAKCSWPAVQALERCSPEQRKVLDECYGVDDAEKVARVKQVFKDLNVEQLYFDYEKKVTTELRSMISKVDAVSPKVYLSMLEKIEGRTK
uniref:Farnesyl pyrophosphate synthase n=1 Tax=Percolomonas cosmopolitus TaxID=63605 RepID=A0A7S1KU22_9EUKA